VLAIFSRLWASTNTNVTRDAAITARNTPYDHQSGYYGIFTYSTLVRARDVKGGGIVG
jgi:hypothetical protein